MSKKITVKSPVGEGIKQFLRTLLVGTVSSVIISLIAIFSLEQLEFLETIRNPLTWYGMGQMIGLFFLKDLLQSLGMGADKTIHTEGQNTGDESLTKGLTRF